MQQSAINLTDHSGLRDSTRSALAHFADEESAPLAADFSAFLVQHVNAHSRDCSAGHVTTGCLIVDKEANRVLLTLHPKVGRWLQTGGHVEPTDADLPSAALREAVEESGIAGLVLDPVPARLDRHAITCAGRRLDHLDVSYIAYAPRDSMVIKSDESTALEWFDMAHLPDLTDNTVRRLVQAAQRRIVNPNAFI